MWNHHWWAVRSKPDLRQQNRDQVEVKMQQNVKDPNLENNQTWIRLQVKWFQICNTWMLRVRMQRKVRRLNKFNKSYLLFRKQELRLWHNQKYLKYGLKLQIHHFNKGKAWQTYVRLLVQKSKISIVEFLH